MRLFLLILAVVYGLSILGLLLIWGMGWFKGDDRFDE